MTHHIRCLFATQAEHEYKIQIQIEIQRKNRNNKEKPTVPTDKQTRQGSTNTSIQIHKNTRYSNK